MIRAAICVTLMFLLMAWVVIATITLDSAALTGSGGIIMGILSVLTVLLSVGLVERRIAPKPPSETDAPPMPKIHPSIKDLMENHRERR